MSIAKYTTILLCVLLCSFALLTEKAKIYENNCNIPEHNNLLVKTFVDDSIDAKYVKKWQCVITKKTLISSLESLSKNESVDLVQQAIYEFKNHNINVIAIWMVGDKIILSVLTEREWHIGLNFDSLNQGRVSIVELTPIEPTTGVE